MPNINKKTMASMIDHTLLKATATRAQISECCRQAKEFGFASVCVNPCHVKLAAEALKNTEVKVCTVIGFPLGANTTEVKAFEAHRAVAEGAAEVDMVMNIGALKEGDLEYVVRDIRQVVESVSGTLVKVIIETCYLDEGEMETACRLARKAGAHFVKTSTGFGTEGAQVQDVALMRKTVGEGMSVKASGGIRTKQDALDMIHAGANRIGTSAGIDIIKEMEP